MRIKVVVPVFRTPETSWMEDEFRKVSEKIKDPGTEFDIIWVKKGVEVATARYGILIGGFFGLLELEKAQEEGYDAAITFCAYDPALDAAKEKLDIPVVGLFESGVHLASMLARSFSILDIDSTEESAKVVFEEILRVYGLDHKLASHRCTDVPILDIKKKKDSGELQRALLEAGRKAVEEDGAEALVLGCGALTGLSGYLQEELGVPVIDPAQAAIKLAEDLVKLRLSQSKKAFAKPSERKITL